MLRLLRTFSWQELRRHPWRNAAAVVAVMLGVALALSVHLINASALDEFSAAVRSASGQPDLDLRAVQGGFDEQLFARVAAHPGVALASPVVELSTIARDMQGVRRSLRVVGIDALAIAGVAPSLMPVPAEGGERFAIFSPGKVFLNPAARGAFGSGDLELQVGLGWKRAGVAGTVSAGGGPLAVMDIAAAQDFFGRTGQLSRIDLRLRPGTDAATLLRELALPPGVTSAQPGDATQRVGQLSRAYRVNLTVLGLVALFTGAFLVYSVLALGVARRAQHFALLGVLGLTAPERQRLVLAESALLGALGSVLGVALGTALAALALRVLGGDLGGGYFPGVTPRLQWSPLAMAGYGLLGVLAACVGGWMPARTVQRLPLAQTLKGLGVQAQGRQRAGIGIALLAAALGAAALPPVAGLPIAAYCAIGLLLVGGVAILPALVGWVYDRVAVHVAHHALALLAVERARRMRAAAAVAVSGVVAALSLAVALTVMVGSFRASLAQWLDVLLPADLYVRTAASSASADTAYLTPEFVRAVAQLPGVARTGGQRQRALQLDAARAPVTVLARTVDDAARDLPLVAGPVPVPAGAIPVYVSEAMVDLYGARAGEPIALPGLDPSNRARYGVAGVWRDYVRQTGAVVLSLQDESRLTGEQRLNDLQVWLAEGADAASVQAAIRDTARRLAGDASLIDIASAAQVRATSLRIFDRSFAVTYWLQAVAVGIGLFGVAASFSAQVLARRKEFGLLAHLGLTRGQVLAVVAGEGAAWTVLGAIAGLALGLGVAVVLVHVVNPQSFHWTMDLLVPWGRLLLLCVAVVVAGTLTAWIAGRAAASRDAVLAVKEDW